ncbi:MAG: glutathione S-transferase domain-containing protein [Thermoleophilaceae bacterium]|nr:glutathione S-transferase domain-containing protein [Thermoleophilaceae bacterium]
MKLYVCYGTFRSPRPGGHPCRNAYEALKEAGWEPEVEKVYGLGVLGDSLNPTRSKIRELTGQTMVPVLMTDDGEVVQDSRKIATWAADHPVPKPA